MKLRARQQKGIKTHAKRTPTGWVPNRAKHFISDGEWSDFSLVSARTGEREIGLFVVDKGLPGFSIGKAPIQSQHPQGRHRSQAGQARPNRRETGVCFLNSAGY